MQNKTKETKGNGTFPYLIKAAPLIIPGPNMVANAPPIAEIHSLLYYHFPKEDFQRQYI